MAFQTTVPKNKLIKSSDLKVVLFFFKKTGNGQQVKKEKKIPSPIRFYPDNVACLSADLDLDPLCHNIM